MPRATGPAATAATPDTTTPPTSVAEPETPATDQPEQEPEPEWGFWRYTGDVERIYTHVPVTVTTGDVIHHLGIPAADGNWRPDPGPATRQPDNWRPTPTPPAAPAPAADTPVKEA